ncbi:MAG: hypothetical protein ACWA5K_08820 [bacterium]
MTKFLDSLSARDRQIVLVALPVIAILLFILIGRYVIGLNQAASERLDLAFGHVAWLEQNSDRLGAGVCGGAAGQSAQQKVREAGITATVETAENRLRVDVSSGQGNRVLNLVEQIACDGWAAESLSLTAGQNSGVVSGRIEFIRE